MAEDIKLTFSAEMGDLLKSMKEHDRLVQEVEKGYKDAARAAKQAEKAAEDTFKKTKDGATDATDKIKTTKEEMGNFESAAKKAAESATNWVGSFVGIGTVVAAVKGLVEYLKETVELQKDMLGKAVDVDKLAQGVAALYKGGLTDDNMKRARSDIGNLAIRTGVDLQTSRNAIFYAKSAFGDTAAGNSAAEVIAKISATGQVNAEKVAALPGLFQKIGADTEEKQMDAANKLVAATKNSVADMSGYGPEFVSTLPKMQALGFSYEDTLAMMNSAIIGTGGNVPEAGTKLNTAARYVAYQKPSSAQYKYMAQLASKQGLDYGVMSPVQRWDFTREAYQAAGQNGTMSEFGAAWGGEAMSSFAMVFTESAEAEYNRVRKEIKNTDPNLLQKEFNVYEKSLVAQKQNLDTKNELQQAKVGREKAAIALLDEMTENSLKLARANAEGAENIPFMIEKAYGYIGLDEFASHQMKKGAKQRISEELLMGAMEQRQDMRSRGEIKGDDPVFKRLHDMHWAVKNNPDLVLNDAFVSELYERTEGFTTYSRESKAAAMDRQTKALEDNTAAMNRVSQQLEAAASAGGAIRPD